MHPLAALHVVLLTLTDRARTGLADRRAQMRDEGAEAGATTLELAVLALGLFLIAGIAVGALTLAIQGRLNLIK